MVEDPISPALVIYPISGDEIYKFIELKKKTKVNLLLIWKAHLLKVAIGNISPYISIKVNKYVVKTVNGMKQFCHIVMSLNLKKKREKEKVS